MRLPANRSGSYGVFTHSGGSVTALVDMTLGSGGSDPTASTYTLNDDDDTAELHVTDDLFIGVYSPATYDQDAGTATVGDTIEIAADASCFSAAEPSRPRPLRTKASSPRPAVSSRPTS